MCRRTRWLRAGNKVAARALVGSVHKFALLARELPSALPPSAAAALRGVPLLGFMHHNALLHLADALLLLQASHAVRACVHTCVQAGVRLRERVCAYACTHVLVCVCVPVCAPVAYTLLYVLVCVCVHVSVRVRVRMCVHVLGHTYAHGDLQHLLAPSYFPRSTIHPHLIHTNYH